MLHRFLAHLTGQAGGRSERRKTLEEDWGWRRGEGAHELSFGHVEFEESSRQDWRTSLEAARLLKLSHPQDTKNHW